MNERQFYAPTYAAAAPDWPGEIDFYRGGKGRGTIKTQRRQAINRWLKNLVTWCPGGKICQMEG